MKSPIELIVMIILVAVIISFLSCLNARESVRKFVPPTLLEYKPIERTHFSFHPSRIKEIGIEGLLPRWIVSFYDDSFDDTEVAFEVSFSGKIKNCNIPVIKNVINASENEQQNAWSIFLRRHSNKINCP